MTSDIDETQASGDQRVTLLTRWLAARSPRRSFLGQAGRGLVASSVGGTAALMVFAESAYASGCCIDPSTGKCYDTSITCECYWGGNCPSETCECGCWTACTANCGHCLTNWCDCCNTTSSGHPFYCDSRCSNRPVNYFYKEWGGGCSTGLTIRCRHYVCSNCQQQPC